MRAGAAMAGVMGIVYGVLCLAAGVGMVVVARPRYGKSRAILSRWVVGQTYVLAILVVTVIGFALIIGAMPALHW
jgi:hypothetical protein